jgi:hypothetical protein
MQFREHPDLSIKMADIERPLFGFMIDPLWGGGILAGDDLPDSPSSPIIML